MKTRKAAVRPAKLDIWQRRLADSDAAWKPEMERMDRREHLYSGDRELRALTKGDEGQKAPHIRNIVFENIESQVSSAIPSPKVTPRRKEDEGLADKIEHWLRCELDRLPFETINDQAERTVPIQGGVGFLVAWDNRKRTHDTVGEEEVAMLHPKQFAPQPGIYTGIQDMDWFIVRQAATKESIPTAASTAPNPAAAAMAPGSAPQGVRRAQVHPPARAQTPQHTASTGKRLPSGTAPFTASSASTTAASR